MAEKMRKINTESIQDMDDFMIDQLKKSPALIPDLLKSAIQDLTAEEGNVKSVMKTFYYITRAKEGDVSGLSRKTGLTRQTIYRRPEPNRFSLDALHHITGQKRIERWEIEPF